MIVNIKLATQPGIPNINGNTYTQQEFDKMINSPYYQSLKENNILYVTSTYSYLDRNNILDFYAIQPDHILGSVIEKYDTSANINLTNTKFINSIKSGELDINDYLLAMTYVGELYKKRGKTYVKNMKFNHYYLINKETMRSNMEI